MFLQTDIFFCGFDFIDNKKKSINRLCQLEAIGGGFSSILVWVRKRERKVTAAPDFGGATVWREIDGCKQQITVCSKKKKRLKRGVEGRDYRGGLNPTQGAVVKKHLCANLALQSAVQ